VLALGGQREATLDGGCIPSCPSDRDHQSGGGDRVDISLPSGEGEAHLYRLVPPAEDVKTRHELTKHLALPLPVPTVTRDGEAFVDLLHRFSKPVTFDRDLSQVHASAERSGRQVMLFGKCKCLTQHAGRFLAACRKNEIDGPVDESVGEGRPRLLAL